jgi:hypothetical protein
MSTPSARPIKIWIALWSAIALLIVVLGASIWWNFIKPAKVVAQQAQEQASVVASQAATFQSALATAADLCADAPGAASRAGVTCADLSSLATQSIDPSPGPGSVVTIVRPGSVTTETSTMSMPGHISYVTESSQVTSYRTLTERVTMTLTQISPSTVAVTVSGFEERTILVTNFIVTTEEQTVTATLVSNVPVTMTKTETEPQPTTETATATRTETATQTATETATQTATETATSRTTESSTVTQTATVTPEPVTVVVTETVTTAVPFVTGPPVTLITVITGSK